MRNPTEVSEVDAEVEAQHLLARAKLAAANERFERALAESERLKRAAQRSADEELTGPALVTALAAAEESYRKSLAALTTDSSDAARWRCARALIELDRLSAQRSARRVR